jgi:uncharacterized protein YjiS (DUF1127 family)
MSAQFSLPSFPPFDDTLPRDEPYGAGALAELWDLFRAWYARAKSRRELESIALYDDHALRDVGLDRHQLRLEAAKPFWRE